MPHRSPLTCRTAVSFSLTFACLTPSSDLPQSTASTQERDHTNPTDTRKRLEQVPAGIVLEENPLDRNQAEQEQRMGHGGGLPSFREVGEVCLHHGEPLDFSSAPSPAYKPLNSEGLEATYNNEKTSIDHNHSYQERRRDGLGGALGIRTEHVRNLRFGSIHDVVITQVLCALGGSEGPSSSVEHGRDFTDGDDSAGGARASQDQCQLELRGFEQVRRNLPMTLWTPLAAVQAAEGVAWRGVCVGCVLGRPWPGRSSA